MEPVRITIRDIPNSTAIQSRIRQKAEKLNQFYPRIHRCHVVVEMPQKHKHQGKLFSVRIDISVPGKAIVVNRKFDEDVYVAIRDAFFALVRQLENYARKRRGDVKNHESVNLGYVKRLFKEEEYGFIQGLDGNEYYFSVTTVNHPSFDQLDIGDVVHFLGVPANDGFHAHRVTKNRHNNFGASES